MGTCSRLFATVVFSVLLLVTSSVSAGGFEMPDNGTRALARGGAFTALADDLTAIAHNPGALIKLRGSSVLLSNHVFFVHERFTRAATFLEEDRFANAELYGLTPLEKVQNEAPIFPLGPFLAAGSDFGLEHFVFAFALYAPNAAGGAKWPVTGGQRYMLTEMESILFYLTGSMAYGFRDTFGVGLSAQVAMAPSMRMQMVIDGSPNATNTLNPYASANDVEAILEVSDLFSFSAILGAWWRPTESIEIGVSGRVVPVMLDASGDFQLQSVPSPQTQFSEERLEVTDSSSRIEMMLAPTARLGVRYRYVDDGKEIFDIEADLVYEAWSVMDAMDVELNGIINLFGGDKDTPDTTIPRQWRDTLSARLGSTVRFLEGGSVSLGAFYETGAVPPNYEHIDFMSFARAGVSVGFGVELGMFHLQTAYMHVFQETRAVSEALGKVYQQRPLSPCPDDCLRDTEGISGVPVNAGIFESSYDIFSLSVETKF
ncbi:MAG: OmpP1/FadL family transporter [Myxococcota bacterium]